MSDRPTISIYANDRIVECYYMRNWPMESLFVECAKLVERISGVTERDKVLSCLGEDPTFGHDEDELKHVEDCSEFPVVIDLTRRMTYLRDDYPQGHPAQDTQPIMSNEEYRQTCNPYVIWPPQKPISFVVLRQVANELADTAPDGRVTAELRNAFIGQRLPQIVANALDDTTPHKM